MKNLILFNTPYESYCFSQEGWQFYCDNQSEMISVIASDVNPDNSIDECDYFSAGILVCPNSELTSYLGRVRSFSL